jgi:hypothetical protein
VHADCGGTAEMAVARVTRSHLEGAVTKIVMRYVSATADGVTSVDEHHTMRLSEPAEFEAAYQAAGLSFERLPDVLRPGRAAYVGVATR